MRELATIEQFQELKPNDKIHLIKGGVCRHFRFCCIHPIKSIKDYFVVISDSSHLSSSVFGIDGSGTWLAGNYDSETVGKIMIQQLEKEIQTVHHIYITKS